MEQCVVVGSERSPLENATCGVPQGSVLGPTLFSLYVCDIKTVVVPESVRILQFADDIMLQESHHGKNTVASNLSTAVSSLAQWLRQRGLILNERKSQVLWICNESTPTVCCNRFPLPDVSETKYLGLIFDRGLIWKPHIANKAAAAAKTIGAFRRAKNSLSIEARWIYYSSILCLTYCMAPMVLYQVYRFSAYLD